MARFPSALLAASAAAVLIAGCGGGDGSKTTASATPQGEPDPAAARAAQRYVDGYSHKDAAAICSVLASAVRDQLAQTGSCVKTVHSTMEGPAAAKLTVGQSYVTGTNAVVTIEGSKRQIKLIKESGAWRVVDGGT